MRIKTLFLVSILISFGLGTGVKSKPIDFDQGWYQFLKKPIKRHLFSSSQVPVNGSILLDKLREIMEAGNAEISKSKHNPNSDLLMETSMKMPNEDNTSVEKFLKDFISIGVVLKDLMEETTRPIPTRTTRNWDYPIQRFT